LKTVPLFALGEIAFFLSDDGDTVYTHHEPQAIKLFRERGFKEVKKIHLLTVDQVPKRQKIASNLPNLPLVERLVPTKLAIPNCTREPLPNLHMEDSESPAVALVRAFEDKFIDGKSERIYSPLKLWHEDARKSNNIKGANLGKITKWIYAYIVIRLIHKDQDPSEISENLKTLSDERKKVTKPAEMNWFDFAIQTANAVA
jgi:hypothetical protein